MSRLEVKTASKAQTVVEDFYRSLERRIQASPPGLCPVDMALNFLIYCHGQSCGKCVPCRIGLRQLRNMLMEVLEGEPNLRILDRIEYTARVIADTADCAIGIEAAQMVLVGLAGFREDFEEHIKYHKCLSGIKNPVPCVALCPAGVDVPGYISLVKEGRCADAVRLIRKDNPFPSACAYICEHPCEARCRRSMIDNPINIKGLKRYAVEHAGKVDKCKKASATGKKVAVVGGGPGGLSAAFYLALMGHSVTVYEKRKQLGGMLRYGIPSYRLPRNILDDEINAIISHGIEVKLNVDVGTEIGYDELQRKFDCLYLAIGAHTYKKAGIEGEDCEGVLSAVELLRKIGDNEMPDFTGLRIAVIGGGNVAMDVTRSAIRLGAEKVTCVYRRRTEDMTAQREEIEGAIAEGAEILTLHSPTRVESDKNGKCTGLWVQPQVIGEVEGIRPKPYNADLPEQLLPADIVIVAVGQGIETYGFEESGIQIKRGGTVLADSTTKLPEMLGVFAGGDCVTGPATVIRAIAAGKAAAANIDEYLGFRHEITADVEVPMAGFTNLTGRGRVNLKELPADERRKNFNCIDCSMTEEEANQEAGRCLRCDHYGYGNLKGGRVQKW